MADDLDAVWKSVLEMLGTVAEDAGAAAAAAPTRVARGATEFVAEVVEAEAVRAPAVVADAAEASGGIAATARASAYVPGHDLIDSVDYSALRQATGVPARGTSRIFERIQRLQGFDGPVTVATRDEVDAAIGAGGQELFRGFDEDRYVDAFVRGPVRPGGGTTGSGTYASPLENVALEYTDPARNHDLSTRQARVLRMALRPDARTVTLRTLHSERSRTLTQVGRELRDLRGAANRTAEEEARYTALLDKELTLADIGQYGALRGYDAIDGSDTWSNREWAVLNPTALVVQR
ncbi:hypothetical protein [Nocardia sp. alder85J]|uniref:hypothetical protein n=1 Tax=Nocardia sp. alder85J TaxID=2862949 RepID=UPI001CD4ADE5|nr:hypothetical protein [Nocardia sp. alder85J]MCX4096929.1 hypothetical protein [Nocardia sp. alder85J]